MEPVRLMPNQVFLMDEDLERDFDSVYDAAKRTFLNYGALSANEIRSLFAVDRKTADEVMDKIKSEYISGIFR